MADRVARHTELAGIHFAAAVARGDDEAARWLRNRDLKLLSREVVYA